jgi:hypothetical protein
MLDLILLVPSEQRADLYAKVSIWLMADKREELKSLCMPEAA